MNKSSVVYWHDRNVQYDESLYKDEKRLYAKLAVYYERESAKLDKEIASYYTRYGVNGVVSYRNLLETLSEADKTLLIEKLDDFTEKYPEYADLVPVRETVYNLNRLEGLRQSIAIQQMQMGAYEQKQALDFFQKQALRYANGAAYHMGFGSNFYSIDHAMIQAAVGNKWCGGKDFSQNIWNNRTKLANALHTDVVNGFIRGDSYHKISGQLKKKFQNVSQKNIERLVFTEDTYLSNEAAMLVFAQDEMFEEYEYVCMNDMHSCDICRSLSGERFKIAERMAGTNFPPMHPWCRCFFDPVLPERDGGKSLTFGANGGIIGYKEKSTKFNRGFSKQNLDNHWYGNPSRGIHSHKAEYPGFTKEQYAERALQLIQSGVDDTNILGYTNKKGQVVRYDVKENDFVKGHPSVGIATMFKPVRRIDYYENNKKYDK